jgi:hypothetical protein
MIILDQAIQPLIRVIRPELNTFALRESIGDFIHDRSSSGFVNGRLAPIFHVTGLAEALSEELARFLNAQKIADLEFGIKQGHFSDSQIDHSWVQSAEVIIDITIRQFRNFPQLSNNPLLNMSEFDYLICDNQSDPLYQLYFEEIV